MLDRKEMARVLLHKLKPHSAQFKHAHMYTLLAALHDLQDANVLAVRPDAAPLEHRSMVRVLQKGAAKFSVELSEREATIMLRDCGLSVMGRVRSILTPWENWKDIHADLLCDVWRHAPEGVEQESLAVLLEDPLEVVKAYEERHPEKLYPRLALVRAARMVYQKVLVPELSHPRELLVRVHEVRTDAEWHGEVLASPDFKHRRKARFESIVLFIPDDARFAHQDEQSFLYQRDATVVHSRSIRHSQRAQLPRRRPGDLVRFTLPR